MTPLTNAPGSGRKPTRLTVLSSAALAFAPALLILAPSASADGTPISGLDDLSNTHFPTGYRDSQGWLVAGESGIDFDPRSGRFVVVRDNPMGGSVPGASDLPNARYLTPSTTSDQQGYRLAFTGGLFACGQQKEQTVVSETAIEARIADELPTGTSTSDVEAWLTAHGFEQSGLIDNARLAHMGRDAATFEIKALIRGSARSALVRSDTQLTFVFDRDRRLISHQVAPVHTGP